MNDDRDIFYAIGGFAFGILSFFHGFNRLRRKRLIENIPTSTVRGLAMGLVELIGKAERQAILKGPLSGKDCVVYRYTVERYEQSGKYKKWVKIASGDSFYCPFWLDDGTGRVLVSPQGAELIISLEYEFETSLGNPIPEHLLDFVKAHNLKYRGLLGNYPLRFKEWHVLPGQMVYVLGSARKDKNVIPEYNAKLTQRLEELKSNQEKMALVDTDNDGVVTHQEWDAAVSLVEQELLTQEMKNGQINEHIDVVVGRSEQEKVCIISDQSQKDLIEDFGWKSFLKVFGGAALSLLMLAYLLFRFRIF